MTNLYCYAHPNNKHISLSTLNLSHSPVSELIIKLYMHHNQLNSETTLTPPLQHFLPTLENCGRFCDICIRCPVH